MGDQLWRPQPGGVGGGACGAQKAYEAKAPTGEGAAVHSLPARILMHYRRHIINISTLPSEANAFESLFEI